MDLFIVLVPFLGWKELDKPRFAYFEALREIIQNLIMVYYLETPNNDFRGGKITWFLKSNSSHKERDKNWINFHNIEIVILISIRFNREFNLKRCVRKFGLLKCTNKINTKPNKKKEKLL